MTDLIDPNQKKGILKLKSNNFFQSSQSRKNVFQFSSGKWTQISKRQWTSRTRSKSRSPSTLLIWQLLKQNSPLRSKRKKSKRVSKRRWHQSSMKKSKSMTPWRPRLRLRHRKHRLPPSKPKTRSARRPASSSIQAVQEIRLKTSRASLVQFIQMAILMLNQTRKWLGRATSTPAQSEKLQR